MEVLKNERKRSLAPIAVFAALADGASGWIHEKSPIISLSVVVASDPESQRPNQNQQCRRERPPSMMGVDERGIKRRQIRPPFVIVPFERTQSSINPKCTEQNNGGH